MLSMAFLNQISSTQLDIQLYFPYKKEPSVSVLVKRKELSSLRRAGEEVNKIRECTRTLPDL